MPFKRGDKFLNFQIEGVLGKGGFGCAYLARDLNLDAPRVIKELLAEHLPNQAVQKRFVNEARAMANLNDPHIVTIHQLIKPKDFPSVQDYFIVMEYMAGGSLEQWLDREGKLPVDQVIRIVTDVCRGLAQAHKQGIVHRDIKPPNILLSDEEGTIVKVTDWGIAHIPGANMNTLGQPGTLFYMSTEQARANISEEWADHETIDPRSDIYSVGAMSFQMLTGRPYIDFSQVIGEVEQKLRAKLGHSPLKFQWAIQQAICQAVIEYEPELPTRYNPAILPKLEAVILKALAKDPRDRFQTAEEMIEALKRVTIPPIDKIKELLDQARTLSGKMKYESALEVLEQAKSIISDDPRVYSEMAAIYNLMRRHSDASQLLETAVKLKPNDPALWRDLGMTYHKLKQTSKAIEALNRSLQLDSKQPGIRALLRTFNQ